MCKHTHMETCADAEGTAGRNCGAGVGECHPGPLGEAIASLMVQRVWERHRRGG